MMYGTKSHDRDNGSQSVRVAEIEQNEYQEHKATQNKKKTADNSAN